MSLGSGTLTWHCAERVVSNLIVLRSTGMNGMPANMMTTIATHTRFSMRIDGQHALVALVRTFARARSHSWITMATNGSANTPLATRMFQMPLLTTQPTRVR